MSRLEYHTRSGLSLNPSQPSSAGPGWTPNTDIYEAGDSGKVVVTMELAGALVETLEVVIKGRVLTVRGERPDPRQRVKCEFQQMEIDYGVFERKLRVPGALAAVRASARYHDGFLTIEIPRPASGETSPAGEVTVRVVS